MVFTNSIKNRNDFFHGVKAQRVGNLYIDRAVFPNNVTVFLVTVPTADNGKEVFFSECKKYVKTSIDTAWEEASFEPPRGDVFIDFATADVVRSVKFADKAAEVPGFYAPVTLKLRAANLSDVESIASSKVSSVKAVKLAIADGASTAVKELGAVTQEGEYVIKAVIIGRNGDEITREIRFNVYKPIAIPAVGSRTPSSLGKAIYLNAQAPDFKVDFPKISGGKSVTWKRNGKKFDPEKDNVFTADSKVVAEILGFDGKVRTQDFIIKAEVIKFWAKANNQDLLPENSMKTVSGKAPFKVIFTSNNKASGAKWYRDDTAFTPNANGDVFEQSAIVRCDYKGQRLFVEVMVSAAPATPKPQPVKPDPKPQPVKSVKKPSKPLELDKVTLAADGTRLTAENGTYTVTLGEGESSVAVKFHFVYACTFNVKIKDDRRQLANASEWKNSFSAGENTVEFTDGKNTITCKVVVEEAEVITPPPAPDDYTWLYIIIGIAIAGGVGFFIFKRLGSRDIMLEMDGETYSKTLGVGEYKIDQTMFPECKDSFTIYITMEKVDGDKNYYVKFKLEHDWQLEAGYNLQTLNEGLSDELAVGSDEYTIRTSGGEEMKLRIFLKDN